VIEFPTTQLLTFSLSRTFLVNPYKYINSLFSPFFFPFPCTFFSTKHFHNQTLLHRNAVFPPNTVYLNSQWSFYFLQARSHPPFPRTFWSGVMMRKSAQLLLAPVFPSQFPCEFFSTLTRTWFPFLHLVPDFTPRNFQTSGGRSFSNTESIRHFLVFLVLC